MNPPKFFSKSFKFFIIFYSTWQISRGGQCRNHADPGKKNPYSLKSRENSRNLLEAFLRSRKEENLYGHCDYQPRHGQASTAKQGGDPMTKTTPTRLSVCPQSPWFAQFAPTPVPTPPVPPCLRAPDCHSITTLKTRRTVDGWRHNIGVKSELLNRSRKNRTLLTNEMVSTIFCTGPASIFVLARFFEIMVVVGFDMDLSWFRICSNIARFWLKKIFGHLEHLTPQPGNLWSLQRGFPSYPDNLLLNGFRCQHWIYKLLCTDPRGDSVPQ